MKFHPTVEKVLNYIYSNQLLNRSDRCLIAVSGGPDSVALLDIMMALKRILRLEIGIAHVNYNLRGKDSCNEQLYVQELAGKNGLNFYLLNLDLKKEDSGSSMEENARNLRYEFFRKTAAENNYNKVVIGHNANDQAETLLLKLIRGTVSGLKGIENKRTLCESIMVIRPLLDISRKEIENYCQEKKLYPKTDKSNLENIYTRNRVRNKILPLLIEENPKFLELTAQTTKVLNQEDKYLEEKSLYIYHNSIIYKNKDIIILSQKVLSEEPVFFRRRVYKNALKDLNKSDYSFSYKNLEAINNLVEKNISMKSLALSGNIYFIKDRDLLIFSLGTADFSPSEFEYFIKVEKTECIKEAGIKLIIKEESGEPKDNKDKIHFSLPEDLKDIKVMSYSPELKFVPLGKDNPISLKNFLDKRKIPEFYRKNLALLYINAQLVWIIGIQRTNKLIFRKGLKTYSVQLIT